MSEEQAKIDAWLHGELSPHELASFEERLARDPELCAEAELARRMEASLKRSFALSGERPAGVASVLEAIQAGQERTRESASAAKVAGFLALAAGLLLVIAPFLGQGERQATPDASSAALAVPSFEGAEQVADGRFVPNLEGILCAAAHYTEQVDEAQCLDDLVEGAGFGSAVGLKRSAQGVLQGPILAPEWPGSVVFANQSSAGLSLLIAGPDELNTCCLDVRPPSNSDMRIHTWRVGETLWYEVSPFPEPRLLSLVDSPSAYGP